MADPFLISWTMFICRRFERHGLCGKDAAFGIHHLDQHLVIAARRVNQDDGVALAVVRPLPRKVVNGDVKMSDARRDVARRRTAYGHDAQILHPVRDEGDAGGERPWKWRL